MSDGNTLNEIKKLLKGYNGNTNLKRAGEQIEFTEENVIEWIKCKDDPIYFINNYCKIISLDEGLVPFKTFKYQERSIIAMHENRNSLHLFPRQTGKCVGYDTIIHIKQKSTNKTYSLKIGDFYKWQSFVKWFKDNIENLSLQDCTPQ